MGDERTWVAYQHRYCGGRVHLERQEDEHSVGLAAICSECGNTDGLDLEAVEVSPVPSGPGGEPGFLDGLTVAQLIEFADNAKAVCEKQGRALDEAPAAFGFGSTRTATEPWEEEHARTLAAPGGPSERKANAQGATTGAPGGLGGPDGA